MDLQKYDKLRNKINKKDFEGNNKGLDSWLFGASFVGNFASIFFSFFLVYPALLKTITISLFGGVWAMIISFLLTNVFLVIYEVVKRYLAKNFSSDYVANRGKMKPAMVGWFTALIAILVLSFYLSLTGSKNLATLSIFKNKVAQTELVTQKDSLSILYEGKKKIYTEDNEALRAVNNNLRQKLAETDIRYVSVRRDYQTSIDKNVKIVEANQIEINKIDEQLNSRITELKTNFDDTKVQNKTEDSKNIILFLIFAIAAEIIIVIGVYFREWFEYTLFIINQQKYEKIHQKKDRYRSLLMFVYGNGKLNTGDQVLPGQQLKEIVAEKTNIQNSNKFVEEFLQDMDRLSIFATTGKRRHINLSYEDALNTIEHFDDAYRILEDMK